MKVEFLKFTWDYVMSRKEQVLLKLQSMDQGQFFSYVQAKLKVVITQELNLASPSDFFKEKGFSTSVHQHKENLNMFLQLLDVSMALFPTSAIEFVTLLVNTMNRNHCVFEVDIPLDLFKQRYVFFSRTIIKEMDTHFFKTFNFFDLNITDTNNIIDFYSTHVCRNEIVRKGILDKSENVKNPNDRAIANYLLLEAAMEYVAIDVGNRKNSIVFAFNSRWEYSKIAEEYKKISQNIKVAKINFSPNSGDLSRKNTNIIDHDNSFSVTQIKLQCIKALIKQGDFYGEKLINKTITASEIQQALELKKLRTLLETLNSSQKEDRFQIIIIFSYLLKNLAMIDSRFIFLENCVSAHFKEQLFKEPEVSLREMLIENRLTSFLSKVKENDLDSLKEAISTQKSTIDTAGKAGPKSPRLFSERVIDDKDSKDNSLPSQRTRTKTPPPRV